MDPPPVPASSAPAPPPTLNSSNTYAPNTLPTILPPPPPNEAPSPTTPPINGTTKKPKKKKNHNNTSSSSTAQTNDKSTTNNSEKRDKNVPIGNSTSAQSVPADKVEKIEKLRKPEKVEKKEKQQEKQQEKQKKQEKQEKQEKKQPPRAEPEKEWVEKLLIRNIPSSISRESLEFSIRNTCPTCQYNWLFSTPTDERTSTYSALLGFYKEEEAKQVRKTVDNMPLEHCRLSALSANELATDNKTLASALGKAMPVFAELTASVKQEKKERREMFAEVGRAHTQYTLLSQLLQNLENQITVYNASCTSQDTIECEKIYREAASALCYTLLGQNPNKLEAVNTKISDVLNKPSSFSGISVESLAALKAALLSAKEAAEQQHKAGSHAKKKNKAPKPQPPQSTAPKDKQPVASARSITPTPARSATPPARSTTPTSPGRSTTPQRSFGMYTGHVAFESS